MTSKFNNPAISEQEIVQENISKKSKGFFSKIKDAITSSKTNTELWGGVSNAILDKMYKNRFTGHVMGALDNSSKILSNTIENVKTSDNAREVVGSVGKGASDFTRNILSTAAGGFGKVVAEPVRALADMATNENDAALGNALNKVGNVVDTVGTMVNPVYAANKTLDTINDVVALGSDIMLAGTDKGVGFKETALDALATTLDFAPEIKTAIKNRAGKIKNKLNIGKTNTEKNLAEKLVNKDVSLKADSNVRADNDFINELADKKVNEYVLTSKNKEEFADKIAKDYSDTLDDFNRVKKTIKAKDVFSNNELNDIDIKDINDKATNTIINSKKYKGKFLNEKEIRQKAEEKAIESFGDNVVDNDALQKKISQEIKKLNTQNNKISKNIQKDVKTLSKELQEKEILKRSKDEFNDFIDNFSINSKENKTQHKALFNDIFEKIYTATEKEDATFNTINNLSQEFAAAVKTESNAATQELYKAASEFLQSKYPKEMVDTLDTFRAIDRIAERAGIALKKANNKQLAKELKKSGKTLPDKITDNFHVFILGDQIGVRPTSDAIKDAIFGKFFSAKEGDKLFDGLKKSVIKDIPKEKADSIVKKINDYIKSNNIDLGIRNPEYNLLKEQYNYNKEEENNQSVLNKSSYNSNKTNYYKTPRPKMSAKELENSLIIPFDF